MVDALIGSKTALAEINGIRVDVDMAVPPQLKVTGMSGLQQKKTVPYMDLE